jgi:2-methylisocitrate lyase-like PEP mutase family enzyme
MDTDRAQRFVDLHAQGCFLLPNAWDLGSARILAAAGFPALATTSAGVAFSLGRPDYFFHTEHGRDGRVDRDTMLDRVRSIVDGLDVPVSADLEEGYGAEPEAVAETIALAVRIGAAGANIEDFTGDRSAPLFDLGHAVERIRAARATLDAAGVPFVLNGRTDAVSTGLGLDEAVRRGNAYLEAGADCVFVPSVSEPDAIATLAREIAGPLNIVMGLTGSDLSMAELGDLGVRRVSVGGSLARAMYHHLMAAARELADHGTFGYARTQIPHNTLNETFLRLRSA